MNVPETISAQHGIVGLNKMLNTSRQPLEIQIRILFVR